MSTDSLFLYHFRSSDNLSLVSPARSPSSSESLTPTPTPTSHNTLIRVRAQAMTIDDSTGLWKVIKGNPAADLKLMKEGDDCYIITAHRHADRQVSQIAWKFNLWLFFYEIYHSNFGHGKAETARFVDLRYTEKELQSPCIHSQIHWKMFAQMCFFIPRHASQTTQDM